MYEEEKQAVIQMNLEEAYNHFLHVIEEKHDKIYKAARFGIGGTLQIDIYDIFTGRFNTKVKSGRIHIKDITNRKVTTTILALHSEKEARMLLIKKFLIDNIEKVDIATPRGNPYAEDERGAFT